MVDEFVLQVLSGIGIAAIYAGLVMWWLMHGGRD